MSDFDSRLGHLRALATMGRVEEALPLAQELMDEQPECVEAVLLRADLMRQTNALESALALYERAVRLAPHSAQALNEQARCLHAMERHDEALAAARQAQEVVSRPENASQAPSVCLTLVWCLREKRLFREALALAEECLARTPDAVLAEWAGQIEQELAASERERC